LRSAWKNSWCAACSRDRDQLRTTSGDAAPDDFTLFLQFLVRLSANTAGGGLCAHYNQAGGVFRAFAKGSITTANQRQSVTQLLNRSAGSGRGSAADELLAIVYDELRSLASSFFRDQKPSNTLQPTALVHEAYLKLVDQSIKWESRNQFFVVAAKAMRSILVDHARSKGRLKHGGGRSRVPLDDNDATPASIDEPTMLAIDEAMTRLAEFDQRKAKLVELRFFGGLTADEAADALGIARSTAAEEWRVARAWLYAQLQDEAS
jgi:RNA polymerase sigma-70 factor, ECF subfamily